MKLFEKYLTDDGLLALAPIPHPVDPGRWPMWRDEGDTAHRHSLCEILYRALKPRDGEWAWFHQKYVAGVYWFLSNEDGQLRRGSNSDFWPGKEPECWERGSTDMLSHILAATCFNTVAKDSPYRQRLDICIKRLPYFTNTMRYKNQSFIRRKAWITGPSYWATRARAAKGRSPLHWLARILGDIHMCANSILWRFKKKNDINSHFVRTLASIRTQPTVFAKINVRLCLDWEAAFDKLESYHTFGTSIRDFVTPLRELQRRIKTHGIENVFNS